MTPPEIMGPPDVEHPGISKIKQMYEHGDFDKIDKMVRYFEALESLGLLGNMVGRFVIWTGIVAGGYLAFHSYAIDWLKGK